ncbi:MULTISPECIES: nucleoside deaminase [Clostridium]|uniref:tRNA-specific adenosine deaminase n=1 Tax=Clostridium novyi (strain NT) TaxID=386415 RepID=A0Q3R7_CLONN|nr:MULTISPECIES: nucleoside deaminase [Clostridium]ABK61546.1 cytidine/deoxycytidylate deaminase family protein, pytative [Clostridium novyi NT]KEH85281.1 adenosine deaminase [Clostridium novyi A str. NCTC 538]KEH86036.1 adenosine deaminase [Clostridium novyi A str. 4540]KEH86443.1 adenosine deaminase [Clostridium novyi A str. BKT29909]KEH92121.1 adenosine deaminase [Clostridium botulinum C/D str. It1]
MDKKFMEIALDEAKIAALKDEVPVGAVIVKNGEVIASAHNLRETLNDPTAHAEILAIKKASSILKNWRLNECEMYVTLEPCPMCSGAILQSRIRKLYIGTIDPSMGCCGSVVDLVQNRYLKTALDIKWFNDDRCSSILTNFFRSKRK